MKIHRFRTIFSVFFVPLFCLRCTVLPKGLPAATVVTFKIYEPKEYLCYTLHQADGVPKIKIKLHFNLKTTYYVPGSGSTVNSPEYDDQSIDFDPATNTWPLTISMKAPSKNSWFCEVSILGIECSECGLQYGDQQEPSGMCGAQTYTDNSTNPATITYQAAKPKWYKSFLFRDALTTADLKAIERAPNILGTCDINCRIH